MLFEWLLLTCTCGGWGGGGGRGEKGIVLHVHWTTPGERCGTTAPTVVPHTPSPCNDCRSLVGGRGGGVYGNHWMCT